MVIGKPTYLLTGSPTQLLLPMDLSGKILLTTTSLQHELTWILAVDSLA